MSCARPRSRFTTGRRLRHLPFQGAYPASAGKGLPRTGYAMTPPRRAPFPFPHYPPGSPSPPSPCPPGLGFVGHLSILPKAGPKGPIPPSDGDTFTASPRTDRAPIPDHFTSSTTAAVELKFLTINVQKAGANSPSLVDIITMLDHHSPDFLLLTETPLPPHSRALRQALRNRGYNEMK